MKRGHWHRAPLMLGQEQTENRDRNVQVQSTPIHPFYNEFDDMSTPLNRE